MSVYLPQDKIQGIKMKCLIAIKSDNNTIQESANLVGSLNATIEEVVPALHCVRELQMYKQIVFSRKTITRTKSHSHKNSYQKFLGGSSNWKFGMAKK